MSESRLSAVTLGKMASAASMPLFIAVWVPLIFGTFMKPGLQPISSPPGKVSFGIDWRGRGEIFLTFMCSTFWNLKLRTVFQEFGRCLMWCILCKYAIDMSIILLDIINHKAIITWNHKAYYIHKRLWMKNMQLVLIRKQLVYLLRLNVHGSWIQRTKWVFIYIQTGRGGGRLSKAAQTSFSQATSSWSSWRILRSGRCPNSLNSPYNVN